MTVIQYNEHADDLVDWGLLEKVMLPQKKLYYFPTSAGEVFMERSLSPDEGGELGGESHKHLLGVRMAAEFYEQQGYNVSLYPDSGDSNKLDVRAEDTKASPSDRNQLIEVETSPEKKGHVLEDYETLKEGYGDGVWVVENTEAAKTLIGNLSEEVENLPTLESNSIEELNDEFEDSGATGIHTLNSLREKLE